MNKIMGLNFLLGLLITGSPVVADDVKSIDPSQHASANIVRRDSTPSSTASATEAASATTTGTNLFFLPSSTNSVLQLPPLSSGVTELKFNEFFRQPIGPRGVEFTDKLRSLEGRRIRILGYMARQAKPADHCFLLAPVALTLNEIEYGHADDLPVTTVHVFTTAESPTQTPYTPGLLLLTGKLSLGNRLETDGRTSTVRLLLDAPSAEQKEAAHAAAKKTPAHDPHAGHAH